MIERLSYREWLIIKLFVFVTITIPLGITMYEFISTGKDSVVFLDDFHPAIGIVVLVYYVVLIVVGLIWLLRHFLKIIQLKNENSKIELKYLQSQVSPHFFFNMLNNLYGLIDKDVDKSKKLILQLSELMRYSVYEAGEERVSVNKEIIFLKNYIDLHRIRYHKEVDIQFITEIEDDEITVLPLLFINLVENAFKHGVENLRKDCFVHIQIAANNKFIDFHIKNNFDPEHSSGFVGKGLENLRKRLDLAYKNRFVLNLQKEKDVFHIQLKLIR